MHSWADFDRCIASAPDSLILRIVDQWCVDRRTEWARAVLLAGASVENEVGIARRMLTGKFKASADPSGKAKGKTAKSKKRAAG